MNDIMKKNQAKIFSRKKKTGRDVLWQQFRNSEITFRINYILNVM